MGNFIYKIALLFSSPAPNDSKIIILGLDGTGKTTLLHRLKPEKYENEPQPVPTIGFNLESVEINKYLFVVLDLGGQEKIRGIWKQHYEGTGGIIFVVDSTDRERIEEAQEELFEVLKSNDMLNAKLLIFANKCDLPGAMSVDEITEKMELAEIKNRKWFIQNSNALQNDGIYEGLDWLVKLMKEKPTN